MNKVEEFNEYRAKMNDKIVGSNNKILKRIFNLDTNAFAEGSVDKKTKEMIGLSSSLVLRCDDCVRYHLGKCYEMGVTEEQVFEIFSIANLIGGTIVIPHLRRAVEYWEYLKLNGND
jgi:AhpD family alkylhydroperoxidase